MVILKRSVFKKLFKLSLKNGIKIVMPSLNKDEVSVILSKYPGHDFSEFVESGTFKGHTIFAVESLFKKLHTIELSTALYNAVKKNYNGEKINFYNGESHIIFDSLLPTLTNPTVFFLDGHWSCADTACGSKQVPLLEELVMIKELYKGPGIIIIDDYRLFDGKDPVVDWSEITKDKVLNILKDRIKEYYFINSYLADKDRMIINLTSV